MAFKRPLELSDLARGVKNIYTPKGQRKDLELQVIKSKCSKKREVRG